MPWCWRLPSPLSWTRLPSSCTAWVLGLTRRPVPVPERISQPEISMWWVGAGGRVRWPSETQMFIVVCRGAPSTRKPAKRIVHRLRAARVDDRPLTGVGADGDRRLRGARPVHDQALGVGALADERRLPREQRVERVLDREPGRLERPRILVHALGRDVIGLTGRGREPRRERGGQSRSRPDREELAYVRAVHGAGGVLDPEVARRAGIGLHAGGSLEPGARVRGSRQRGGRSRSEE